MIYVRIFQNLFHYKIVNIAPCVIYTMVSLVAQSAKNLPAVHETWVQSLGQEDPLEKEMVNHFSILAWKVPWTQEPGGLQPMGCKELRTTERLTHCVICWCLLLILYTVVRMLISYS